MVKPFTLNSILTPSKTPKNFSPHSCWPYLNDVGGLTLYKVHLPLKSLSWSDVYIRSCLKKTESLSRKRSLCWLLLPKHLLNMGAWCTFFLDLNSFLGLRSTVILKNRSCKVVRPTLLSPHQQHWCPTGITVWLLTVLHPHQKTKLYHLNFQFLIYCTEYWQQSTARHLHQMPLHSQRLHLVLTSTSNAAPVTTCLDSISDYMTTYQGCAKFRITNWLLISSWVWDWIGHPTQEVELEPKMDLQVVEFTEIKFK